MKYLILYILIYFVGYNVTNKLGINYNLFTVFLIIYSLMLFFLLKEKITIKLKRNLFWIILFVLIYGYSKLQSNNFNSSMLFCVLNVVATPILLLSIPTTNHGIINNKELALKQKYRNMLLCFFVSIVVVSYLEKLLKFHIFPWSIDVSIGMQSGDTSEFRSNAFHGHPLQNALIVATIMNFLLISKIKFMYKYVGWFVGLVSLMCFNTRASTVISILYFGIHLFQTLSSNRETKTNKQLLLFFSVIILIVVVSLILGTSLGGRLANDGLMDESAQVRIDIWSIFEYYPIGEFMFGLGKIEDIDVIMSQAGLYATENFIIDWIFSFGCVFIIVFICLYFRLVNDLYKDMGYTTFEISFTALNFLMIAGTNNSLSASFVPLFNYIFCIYIFSPSKECYSTPV